MKHFYHFLMISIIVTYNHFSTYGITIENDTLRNESIPNSYFEFNSNGFTDYVVLNYDSISNIGLFWKSIDWVNLTYKYPNEVIISQLEGEYLIIEGIANSLLETKVMGVTYYDNMRYRIHILFKNNKLKFDVTSLESYNKGSQYISPGWYDMKIDEIEKYYYNKKGKIQTIFKSYETNIPKYFNDLVKSLNDYIIKGNINSDNNW